jgi:hypothetical protein
LDAGKAPDLLEEAREERDPLRLRILGVGQGDLRRQQVVRLETGINLLQANKAVQQQAGAY